MYDYEIQAMIGSKTRGKVVLPDGDHYLYSDLVMHDDLVLEGESEHGTILNVLGTGLHAVKYVSPSGIYRRCHVGIRNMTIRTSFPNNCGLYVVLGGATLCENVTFQGVDRTAHYDRGMGHKVRNCAVETYSAQSCGSLVAESTTAGYCGMLDVDSYQTYFSASGPAIIMHRAINAQVRGLNVFASGQVGVLIDDDSQGVQLDMPNLTSVVQGVLVQTRNGVAPQNIDVIGAQIDQSTGASIAVYGGSDVRVLGGEMSNGFQGIEIGSYPGTERVSVRCDILGMVHNGVVVMSNGKWFDVKGCRISASGGAGIVISGGQSNYYEISGNDVSQANRGGGIYDFSGVVPGEPLRRVISGNILP
jgi:hypothetical protein